MNDFRYAVRTLRRSPSYAVTATAVLGIGIALATVAFAVVDGVLFKPLPYSRPHELYLVRADVTNVPGSITTGRSQPPPVSGIEIDAWAAALPGIAMTAVSSEPFAFRRGDGPEYWAAEVDERFFDVLGSRPLLGGFNPEDFDWYRADEGRAVRPVMISYRYWQRTLGGDPNAVGRNLAEWRRPGLTWGERVVGVLPPDFVFPVDADQPQPEILSASRGTRGWEPGYQVLLRLPADTYLASVRDRLMDGARVAAQVTPPDHQRHAPFDAVRLVPVTDQLGRHERPAFAMVFAGASVLLLLSCLNVAGLAAARNIERRRDVAVRRALGAGIGAIAKGLLAEITLLAIGAAGVALLIAKPILVWTIALLPATVTLLKAPAVDGRVFAAMAVFALATVAIVALWPARVATQLSGPSSLASLSAAPTRVGRRSSAALIAAQVALAFVLVTAGALTVASLAAAWLTDAGYQRDRTILAEAYIRNYADGAEATRQLEEIDDLLLRIPGVARVATSSIQPLFRSSTGRHFTDLVAQGWTGDPRELSQRRVSDGFFEVMGLRLIDGRWALPGEWIVDQPIAIVSETAARKLWPGQSAVGQLLVAQSPRRRQVEPARTVIGVVADARYTALDDEPTGDIYVPDRFEAGRTGVFFHVRTTSDASMVLPLVAQALKARNVFANQISTHEDALFASVKHRALPAWLFGSLAVSALLLCGVGILGLLAMSAAQRRREMGIRVALGATTGRVVALIVREQAAAVGAGLLAGAAISLWAVGFAESQLYGVGAYDPAVWVSVALVLSAVALIGTLIPSLRAARVNPVEALRHE
jgi:putative ABC transport system permease protein